MLADSAKYDASCASSGSSRGTTNGIGIARTIGVCHSWSTDGRCISLLKVLFTNHCIYDCAYCVNRRSNDIRRTSFTVDELVELTKRFYTRNYIEGLFLSSGIAGDPDFTMRKLIAVARRIRRDEGFGGYIHLKAIAGTMDCLADKLQETREDRKHRFQHVPCFAPAGQSTQLIVGRVPRAIVRSSRSPPTSTADSVCAACTIRRLCRSVTTNAYPRSVRRRCGGSTVSTRRIGLSGSIASMWANFFLTAALSSQEVPALPPGDRFRLEDGRAWRATSLGCHEACVRDNEYYRRRY